MFALGFLGLLLLQKPIDERPACNADTVGLMWPNEANLDPQALYRLSRAGELWLCTKHPWRYKWEKPSVSVAQLKKEREEKSAKH
jgi:hypothetical protein